MTTPFLFTFEMFNKKVHNCLVDYTMSSNVMPYAICKKLNVEPLITNAQIVRLVHSRVKVMGELRDVLIRLASNSKVRQVIDVIFMDILESYGLLLSRDWSSKLNGY